MTGESILKISACILSGYLLGCLSPAFIIGIFKGYDVRKSGSKNAGASNTVLLAGKMAGLVVAVSDILKAALAWYMAALISPEARLAPIIGGVSCIIGHMYPVFLRFKGGKGLACLGGVVLAYSPKSFVLMLSLALLIAAVTNYVCMVTVGMSIIFPAYYGIMTGFWVGAIVLFLPTIPIFIKHLENFRRIRDGQELRLSYLWNKEGELGRTGYEDTKS